MYCLEICNKKDMQPHGYTPLETLESMVQAPILLTLLDIYHKLFIPHRCKGV